MTIKDIAWNTYELPFVKPLTTARTTYKSRKGYIVRIIDDAGNHGLGDVAPLPEFGTESFEFISELLPELHNDTGFLSSLDPNPRSIFNGLNHLSEYPAVRSGVEQALIMLASKQVNKTIPEFLLLECDRYIKVNGLIGMLTPEETFEKTRELIALGYRTIKLKIGRDDIAKDIQCIEAIQKIEEDISLRLDVNSAWDETSVISNLNALAGFDIEYIEDPVVFTDYTSLASIRKKSPVKIALDEPVRTLANVVNITKNEAADVLIVKPVICGGLLNAIRIMHTAKEYNIRTVISSVFESAVGRSVVVLLASTRSDIAHGLDTARNLSNDIIDDHFPVVNGGITIHDPELFSFNL